jgi:hypothetical protein
MRDIPLSALNKDRVDIYIEPALDRHLEAGFNLTKLNLTWTALEYDAYNL